jgi:hypothetical protein
MSESNERCGTKGVSTELFSLNSTKGMTEKALMLDDDQRNLLTILDDFA